MSEESLLSAVMEAMTKPTITSVLNGIYSDIAVRLETIRPRCLKSGRCCRFEQYGHRLYITTAELAVFAMQLRNVPSLAELAARPDHGACRFQENALCLAHALRPMGCRIFFCDQSKDDQLTSLYEQMHQRIRQTHEQLGIAYRYVEWRQGLGQITPLLQPVE